MLVRTRMLGLASLAASIAVLSFSFASCAQGQAAPGNDGGAPAAAADSDALAPFSTKYAYFVPSRFSDLPGWLDDSMAQAWKAFQASCSVLANRAAWAGPCARSASVNARNDDEIRRYLEREFTLYQIRNKDQSSDGIITGYYEPLLRGSRRYGHPYVYPVYAIPDDMLYLDSRSIPRTFGGTRVFARVEGRNVVSLCTEFAPGTTCNGPYEIDVADAKPDIRDKKLRVRIDGQRIVPYYTRAQIDQGALASARVIVWVDDPAALYSMHVQGSGKARLPDGEVVRLAYAEQNGHPFTPPVQASARKSGSRPALLTRGIELPQETPADAAGWGDAPRRSVAAPAAGAGGADENLSPEVERMVELLLKGNTDPQPMPAASTTSSSTSLPTSAPKVARPAPVASKAAPLDAGEGAAPKMAVAASAAMFSSDPSYVFFRQIPDSEGGPMGALGVPLTPGRSVAVDPRTTPLGFPVFISTEGQGIGTRLNRLVLAQDTGGAIRGPVRADYFWGFGPGAGELASRMKENGRIWLLLPKDLQLKTGPEFRTRGIRGTATGDEAECLVPDPDLCVE